MMKNWLSEHGWKTVKSFWRHWYPSGMQSYNKLASYPLLDTQTILGLKEQIQIHQNNSSNHKEIQHPMTGDSRSIFRGGGLDFEESRMYQAGDDLRYMNWRLTARSGEPYMKVFREERQPGIFIVVDRRPSMRFGTKKRLKSDTKKFP